MKQTLLTIFSFFIFGLSFSQEKQIIETTDIDNFWIAFDKLKSATTQNDSIEIIQTNYIDQSTEYFKEFIRIRNFTAEEYVKLIGKYPKFWNSIRKETEKVKIVTFKDFKEYKFDAAKNQSTLVKVGDEISPKDKIATGDFTNDTFYKFLGRILLLSLFLFISMVVYLAYKKRVKEGRE